MTAFRLISLPTHGLFEMILGMALMAAPFALGFGPAGTLVAFALGVLVVGMALGASDSLPVATHFAIDQALVALSLAGALFLALSGDKAAAAVFLAAAIGLLTLNSITRYSRPLRA